MGYLPKHIKVRRHRWNVRVIATAALSGAMIVRSRDSWKVDDGDDAPAYKRQYNIRYADGQQSRNYDSRGEAASVYLLWWFDKHNMFPRYR